MAVATKSIHAKGRRRGSAGKRAAVPPHWKKLFKLIPGYDPEATAAPGDHFSETKAQHAIDFIQKACRHIEGSCAGDLFILQPWQMAIVGCLFGWLRADGTRRYRELFLYIARGNGKTPLLAVIALYMLFCDGEAGAQIYFVASESKQAGLAFRHASGMIKQNPVLDKESHTYKGMGHRSIVLNSDEASSILVISSDAKSKHGFAPHLVVGDELHAWEDHELLEALETAFAKKGRRQPMKIWATTADFDRPSPCNEKYDYAKSVRDNGGDPSKPGHDRQFLPIIFEALPTDDWTQEETWEKANPNIDITVDRASLADFVRKALDQPRKQAEFKRLHLNIQTTSQTIFIPLERWDECRGELSREELRGRPCFAALDVSSKQDITAFVLVFPPSEEDEYAILPFFWIPEANMEDRQRHDKVPYREWVDRGLVMATPGNMIDEDTIEQFVLEIRSEFQLIKCGFDSWNAMGLGERLQRAGIEMVDVPQTITRLTAGTKGLDDLTADGRIIHDGNPVFRWMLSCTETVGDKNQNIRPVKPDRKKTGKRIDGVVAAVMALGLSLGEVTSTPQCIVF